MFCLPPSGLHTARMRRLWMLPLAMSGALLFPSCSSTGGGPTVTTGARTFNNPMGLGPFDASGNYVEAWADAPHKWPTRPRPTAPTPSLEIPTPNPVVPPATLPTAIAASDPAGNPPAITKAPGPINSPPEVAALNPAKPKPATKPAVKTTAKTTAAKPTVKTTAKATAAKPKNKSATNYTVKKGDTLYDLSKRFGTPIAAIQRANGLKGSNLSIGKKLVIPRY
jgi:LysM repeat protein